MKYGMGGLSHETLMKNIELYGTQVIPRVRELLAQLSSSGQSTEKHAGGGTSSR
jgi:hypothetical protein